jgi:hypothetical protein
MRGHVAEKRGRYYLVFDVGRETATGRRKQRWHSGPDRKGYESKRAAERALRQMLTSVDHGTYVDPSTLTVGQYLEDWLPTMRLRPSTMNVYRTQLAAYVLPGIGNARLQALTPDMLDALYVELERAGGKRGQSALSEDGQKRSRDAPPSVRPSRATIADRAQPLRSRREAEAEGPRDAPLVGRGDGALPRDRRKRPPIRRVPPHGHGRPAPGGSAGDPLVRPRPHPGDRVDPTRAGARRQVPHVQRAEDRCWPTLGSARIPGDRGAPHAPQGASGGTARLCRRLHRRRPRLRPGGRLPHTSRTTGTGSTRPPPAMGRDFKASPTGSTRSGVPSGFGRPPGAGRRSQGSCRCRRRRVPRGTAALTWSLAPRAEDKGRELAAVRSRIGDLSGRQRSHEQRLRPEGGVIATGVRRWSLVGGSTW